MFTSPVFDWTYSFWANFVPKIKIVSLSWNLVTRLLQICRTQWWCSPFLFYIICNFPSPPLTFSEKIRSKNERFCNSKSNAIQTTVFELHELYCNFEKLRVWTRFMAHKNKKIFGPVCFRKLYLIRNFKFTKLN